MEAAHGVKISARGLCALCTLVYMVSYIARVNLGASVLAIVQDTGFSPSRLAVALTGSFITYGAGQLLSGWFGDRLQPRRLVFAGLILTGSMNALMAVCARPWQMAIVWFINGFAQSLMWPPLIRLMVSLLDEKTYSRGMVIVALGSSIGTILVYLTVPLLIRASWRWVFFLSALCALITAKVWREHCPRIGTSVTRPKGGGISVLLNPLVIAIMLAIAMQGMLRDGVTTWLPSFVSDTFALSNSVSIMTGVLLPLFGIGCVQVAARIYNIHTDPVACAAGMFSVGVAAAGSVIMASGHSAVVSVVGLAVLTGCMHGVNHLLISMVPAFYRDTGAVSTVSGALNACTYIGSAISTYGIASVTEHYGWPVTLRLWMAIAAVGAVLCFACIRPWHRRFH
ncbi:MAG: MFS transporter [Clostridia bacterium]|nr:MFS transporter [Clostridia bacterium]